MTRVQELRKQIIEARLEGDDDRETALLAELGRARDKETRALSLEEAYGQLAD